jgi:CDGSH-type Zn-finger protein/uncharacterized Fe-S cluster protein YjdI
VAQNVEGKGLTVHYDGSKCIHSRGCVLTLPTVFRPNVQGEWIDPDGASVDAIAALATRCPSGAIRVTRKDGIAEVTPGRNTVTVTENGPYAVRGQLRVAGEDAGTRATLCRCGHSARKPYCDGAHAKAGFQATGEFPVPAELPAWGEPGVVEVTPLPNGPLRVAGAHEVTSGSGKPVRRGETAFLCRCGASANKPFCDGSHRGVGFSAG